MHVARVRSRRVRRRSRRRRRPQRASFDGSVPVPDQLQDVHRLACTLPIVVVDCSPISDDSGFILNVRAQSRLLSVCLQCTGIISTSVCPRCACDPIATYTARRLEPHRHRLNVHRHQRSLRGRAHVSTPERCHNEPIIISAGRCTRCTRKASVPAALHFAPSVCVCRCVCCVCACILNQTRPDSRPFTHTHSERSCDTPLDPGASQKRLNSGGSLCTRLQQACCCFVFAAAAVEGVVQHRSYVIRTTRRRRTRARPCSKICRRLI